MSSVGNTQIPEQWLWCSLRDIGQIISGGTPSTKEAEFWGGDISWISPSDLTGYTAKFISRGAKSLSDKGLRNSSARLIPSGSIHFSSRAPIGYTVISSASLSTNQGFKSLSPYGGIFNEFVYYWLKHIKDEAQARATGTTFKEISGSAFANLPIPIPPSAEQKRIVTKIEELFSELDKGIETLKTAKAQLAVYRKAILKSACEGELVPTEAKLAKAEGHTYETGEQLLQRILTERRTNWTGRGKYKEPTAPDTANLPDLPEGWVYVSVESVGLVQLGRQRAPQHHNGENMRPYLRVANVFEDRLDLDDVMEMNFTPTEFETFQLKPNDVLLNEGQSLELVGRPAIYKGEIPGACFTNTLVRFRPFSSLDVKYALSVFRAFMHFGRFQKIARWTTSIAHLGSDRFAKMAFPLPPLAEQKRIVEEVERCLSVIEDLASNIEANLQKAEALRQSILKKAFAGELVPQDPSDEPASVLLERIRAERAEKTPRTASLKPKTRSRKPRPATT
jgi:type I restriction enzyme S subunit